MVVEMYPIEIPDGTVFRTPYFGVCLKLSNDHQFSYFVRIALLRDTAEISLMILHNRGNELIVRTT